jgi:CDP-glucose 4,6-dehydratase
MGRRQSYLEGVGGTYMNYIWEDKKVLITGATGMVGSWLVKELLNRKAVVVALVRDIDYHTEFYRSGDYLQSHIVNGPLEDYSTVERAINEYEIDTVFHLGAQTIVGTYNLLESCRRHGDLVKRIVIASSDKAYGISDKLPYTEDMALKGNHPYDVSKTCTDLLAQTYHHTYGINVVISRCGNIYGGGDLNWSRIVPGTIRSLLNNQRPVIRSNGKMIRDYIYVKDVIDGYVLLAESAAKKQVAGEAFNFSTEEKKSVIEIVDEITTAMHTKNIKPRIMAMDLKEIPEQTLSSAKAGKVLEWTPKYTLKAGLAETIQWYKSYLGGEKDTS